MYRVFERLFNTQNLQAYPKHLSMSFGVVADAVVAIFILNELKHTALNCEHKNSNETLLHYT